MRPELLNAAALHLVRARQGGARTAAMPNDCAPRSVEDGYAVQYTLNGMLARAGYGPVVGHKIGCTTPVMQRYLGIDHPSAGEVFETTAHRDAAEIQLARYHRLGVECEIAAILGEDLPATGRPYTAESVAPAVRALAAAIEVVEDRYEDFTTWSAASLIADDFFNAGVVIGPPIETWRTLDPAGIRGRMTVDGREIGSGVGADILGHPRAALAWLADLRAGFGRPLREGEFVMLGSVVKTEWIDAPATVEVDLDGLGGAAIEFS
jgi:2-keto-4-pentenoate hydratase